jgi:hypothetical protein
MSIIVKMLKKLILSLLFFNQLSSFANDDVQVSAFGTIGLVMSDSDRYGYRKDVSYDKGVYSGDTDFLNHSLFGFQLDASLNSDIDFVGQAVIRDMTDSTFENYITLGFLRYTPTANWQFRVGRTAPDIFLITEYIDIGVAYIWATPPNEVYGIIPFRSLDGADVTYTSRWSDTTLRTKFFTGKGESTVASPFLTVSAEVENIYGLSVNLSTIDWSIQAQHTQIQIAEKNKATQQVINVIAQMPPSIWPGAKQFSENLTVKGTHANYSSISGQAYLGQYLFTAELSRIDPSDTETIPTLTSGYTSLAYQYDEHTFYSVYSFIHSQNYTFDEPGVQTALIPELIGAVESINNFYVSNQKTFSLGWRWNFRENISSSLQWNNTQIDDNGGTLWLNNSDDPSGDTINVLMFSVSFTL